MGVERGSSATHRLHDAPNPPTRRQLPNMADAAVKGIFPYLTPTERISGCFAVWAGYGTFPE